VGLAETAALVASLELRDKGFGSGVTRAEAQLNALNTAANRTGPIGSTVSRSFSVITRSASGLSGALNHAKGAIGGFISGPLGLLGLGAGVFSIAGLFKESIGEAKSFGDEVFRLTALTGQAVGPTSQIAAALEHFGVAGDDAIKVASFFEKNAFKLSGTTKLAEKFTAKYGLTLVDATGKLVDFNTAILRGAAYWNDKAIPAGQKAAGLAAIFGRNYTQLIPILTAGPQKIQAAMEEAQSVGLTLTKDNIEQLAKAREATLKWGTSFAGLKLQAGLTLLPLLTDLQTGLTGFLAGGGKDQIISVLKEGIGFAKQLGGAIVTIGGAFRTAWGAIPPEFRQLLLTGLVANKALKVVFGFDPLKIVGGGIADVLGGAFKGFLGRGSSAANAMWVQGAGIGGANAGGPANLLTKVISIGAIVGSALAVFETWQSVNDANSKQATEVQQTATDWLKKQPSKADLETGLAGVEQGINDIRSNPLNVLVQGDALQKLDAMKAAIEAQLAKLDMINTSINGIQLLQLPGVQSFLSREHGDSPMPSLGPRSPRGPGIRDPGGRGGTHIVTPVFVTGRDVTHVQDTKTRVGPAPQF
jgi:hypothetical protein